jgi:predicted HTH transcriptional regulator
MSAKWDQAELERHIKDGVEENLNLDYKAADALGTSDGKKKEITKDVSAFANSAGGIIIYGIKEYDDDDTGSEKLNSGRL